MNNNEARLRGALERAWTASNYTRGEEPPDLGDHLIREYQRADSIPIETIAAAMADPLVGPVVASMLRDAGIEMPQPVPKK